MDDLARRAVACKGWRTWEYLNKGNGITLSVCRAAGSLHETGIQFGAGFVLWRWMTLLTFLCGWGWDDAMPLRPWPQWVPDLRPGRRGGCFGICGFWVNVVAAQVRRKP